MTRFLIGFICGICAFGNTFGQINRSYSVALMDAETGEFLYEKDSLMYRYPASLTKMMTLFLTFDLLKKGLIKFDDVAYVSREAALQVRSNIELQYREGVTVGDLISSISVTSANDGAYVLAEFIGGGSMEDFVSAMNRAAQILGMKNTHFMNPNGLHHPSQFTNAKDMAVLSRALWQNYREFFDIFAIKEFSYSGRIYRSHNYLFDMYSDVYGIKTGYVNASGYNLASLVSRSDKTLIAVVLHINKRESRDNFMVKLLDYGFEKIR